MRGVWWVAALIATGLAGCADDAPSSSQSETEEPQEMVVDGNDTIEPVAPSLPTVTLVADVVNGTAPLLVQFTIEASNATTWTIDFGDGVEGNGTGFPASVNHTFAAGSFRVNVTVYGDGGYNVTSLNVTALEAGPQLLPPWEGKANLDRPCIACHNDQTDGCVWRQLGSTSPFKDCAWLDFPDEYAGIGTYTLTASAGDPGLRFYSSCGSGTVGGPITNTGTESGKIPAGAVCALIWQGDATGSSTLTFTAVQLP